MGAAEAASVFALAIVGGTYVSKNHLVIKL